jgi:hypothetical protein
MNAARDRTTFLDLMSRTYVRREAQKPLFGKEFLRVGQSLLIDGYLFQLGGILGRAFRSKPIPFASVFAAAADGGPKLVNWLQGDAARTVAHYGDRVKTINEFIFTYELDRLKFAGDVGEYFLKHGLDKLKPEAVHEMATIYGVFGAGFGMVHPEMFVAWYENTHAKVEEEQWQLARRAGLDIPKSQERIPYHEQERDDVQVFREYTLQFFPEFAQALGFM